jgi:hypothetical protein
MKTAISSLSQKSHSRLCAVFGLVFLGLVCGSRAQIINLNDGNSTVAINTAAQGGMFLWNVDGVNQLSQQWFWYRVGSAGPERSIDTISAPVITPMSANVAAATYNNGQFSVRTTYTLGGGLPGSGASDIGESISINNLTGSPLQFHFFQYADFSLSGTPGNDYTQLGTSSITHLFNEAAVWDANLTLRENVDTTAAPGANHGEVALAGITLGELNDGLPTVLSDQAGPFGPNHYTWALEWDLNIGSGGTVIISGDKNLQAALVPEPSTLALALLGLIACGTRRLRRSA